MTDASFSNDPERRFRRLEERIDMADAAVAALEGEAGADDVLRAPFAYAELLARVRALLRRDVLTPPRVIEYESSRPKGAR